MDIQEARKGVASSNSRERLDAARVLARKATPGDLALISEALRTETVSWIRASLERAERRAAGTDAMTAVVSDLEEPAVDAVYAQAIEETTGRLIHEIVPIVGALRTYAELEIEKFAETEVRRQIEHLEEMLEAIERISRAARSPKLLECNLADVLTNLAAEFSFGGVEVRPSGPDPLNLITDPVLIGLAIRSGLTNAAEASLTADADRPAPIGLKWDATDRDYWISVLDRGIGLPPTAGKIFEVGISTKRRHLGMGLPLAMRAAQSLGGTIRLTPRKGGGVQFLLRAPRFEVIE